MAAARMFFLFRGEEAEEAEEAVPTLFVREGGAGGGERTTADGDVKRERRAPTPTLPVGSSPPETATRGGRAAEGLSITTQLAPRRGEAACRTRDGAHDTQEERMGRTQARTQPRLSLPDDVFVSCSLSLVCVVWRCDASGLVSARVRCIRRVVSAGETRHCRPTPHRRHAEPHCCTRTDLERTRTRDIEHGHQERTTRAKWCRVCVCGRRPFE